MNIGIVTYWYERGAAYVSKQFEKILSCKHNVFIYARGGEKYAKMDPNWDHPNVYWSNSDPHYYRTFISKKEFEEWIGKNNIEAVLFNEQTYFEPILWCREMGVKSIAYIDYYTEDTIPLFGAYDALICNTKRHYSAFESFDTAYYLPWGTDIDLYSPHSDSGKLVKEGNVVFFNSAGMSPERKGTDLFIKALELCSSETNIKGLIHSQKELMKCMPEMTDTINRLEKKGVLKIIEGTIPAPGLYTEADVYVYPSRLDGIGLTVPEALSSGLACIVSDNPPMNEFIKPDHGNLIPVTRLYARSDGYYWPQCNCDYTKLAEIMKNYAHNLDMVIEMKKNARVYAKANLSVDINFKELANIIEHITIHDIKESVKDAIYKYDREGFKRYTLLYAKTGLYKLIPLNIRNRKFYKNK